MSMSDMVSISENSCHNPYEDLKMRVAMCDLFYKQQCSRNYIVEELDLIRSQSELLEQIKSNLSSKRLSISICKEDREATRDVDTTNLSHTRSIGALIPVGSPTNSCVSSRTCFFRRASAIQPMGVNQLLSEVEAKCSVECTQLLRRLLGEGNRLKELERENKKLRHQIAKANKQVEEIKLREIEAAAKLYDVNKKLQAYEATAADMRRKREDYIAKVTELEQKQLQMNKFEISLMVREKMARAQSIGFNEWTRSIQKYRSDVHTLRNSIEQVISDPDAYTYRKLADTVIRSLDSQDAELEQQSQVLAKMQHKLEQLYLALKK